MKQFICKALVFLRIVDRHDGLISLTNVAMIVIIVKLAMIQQASVFDLGTFFVAATNVNMKKWLNRTQMAKDALVQVDNVSTKIKQAAQEIGVSINTKE